MLQGYFDNFIVDLESESIIGGKSNKPGSKYIGIFDDSRSEPWEFYSATDRHEIAFEPIES